MIASRWQAEFAQLIEGLSPCFCTPASLHRAEEYLRGLFSSIPRHNSWQLSEVAGAHNPWALQQFLSKAVWESADVRDALQDYVALHLDEKDSVLVLDETGFLKKGTHSAGVQRQYSGTAGRVENCQVGVFAAYAGRGHALVDGRLYLPCSWIEDAEGRKQAHIPEEMPFRTKPEIALEIILHARKRLPFSFVTGDSVYGDRHLRLRLESEGIAHVLGASGKEYVDTSFGRRERVSRLLDEMRQAPAEVWHRLPSGQGSKGSRLGTAPGLAEMASRAAQPGGRTFRLRLHGSLRDITGAARRGAGKTLGDRELLRVDQATGRARRVRGARV